MDRHLLERASRMFNRVADLRTEEDQRINEWFKAMLDASPRLPPSPDDIRWLLAELTRLRDSLARCEALVAEWDNDQTCYTDDLYAGQQQGKRGCAKQLAAALASRERQGEGVP